MNEGNERTPAGRASFVLTHPHDASFVFENSCRTTYLADSTTTADPDSARARRHDLTRICTTRSVLEVSLRSDNLPALKTDDMHLGSVGSSFSKDLEQQFYDVGKQF